MIDTTLQCSAVPIQQVGSHNHDAMETDDPLLAATHAWRDLARAAALVERLMTAADDIMASDELSAEGANQLLELAGQAVLILERAATASRAATSRIWDRAQPANMEQGPSVVSWLGSMLAPGAAEEGA